VRLKWQSVSLASTKTWIQTPVPPKKPKQNKRKDSYLSSNDFRSVWKDLKSLVFSSTTGKSQMISGLNMLIFLKKIIFLFCFWQQAFFN
jgi:hypothetical protein